MADAPTQKTVKKPRIRAYDALRGFSVLSMVLFHFCYDLRYIAGLDLAWFDSAVRAAWSASISWVFLFIAGVMCSYSRNNLVRGAKYMLFAALIFVVTWVADLDIPILYGIIYCMAASTLVDALLEKAGLEPRGIVAMLACLALFYVTYDVAEGYLALGPLHVDLPPWLFNGGFNWLGTPSPAFESGDYYPLLPYLFMYAAGISFGRFMKAREYPAWFTALRCKPLEFLGRHALAVYVIHQPVLLVIAFILNPSIL